MLKRTFMIIGLSLALHASTAAGRDLAEILQEKGVLSEAEATEAAGDKHTLRAFWKEGLRLETADGAFKLKLGGRIHNDWAAIFSSDALEEAHSDLASTETGTSLRRARLALSGSMYSNVVFKAEYDFAGGGASFKDVYLGLVNVPYAGSFTVGHFKEPFSLEELGSSNHVTFLERALPNAFAPSRNTGLMWMRNFVGSRMTAAAGAFHEADDTANGFGSDSDYNVSSRVTGLPLFDAAAERLVHLGLGYSHKFRNDDDIRFRQRPEASLMPPRLVDTGDLATDGVDMLGPEAAMVLGPLSLQCEYIHTWADTAGNDAQWHGYYLFASYFLTGESRQYDPAAASFGRTKPQRNLAFDGSGWGAWEVALRYSALDLESESDRLADVTAGLNWYLNPNTRVMLNYVYADVDDGGSANIVQSRFQVDF